MVDERCFSASVVPKDILNFAANNRANLVGSNDDPICGSVLLFAIFARSFDGKRINFCLYENLGRKRVNYICPCCKQPTPEPFLVSLDTNTILANGKLIKVTARQTELAHLLASKFPGVASYEYLIRGLYHPGHEPDDPANTMKAQMSYLRGRLFGSGWTIQGYYGRGYQLIRGEPLTMRTKFSKRAEPVHF